MSYNILIIMAMEKEALFLIEQYRMKRASIILDTDLHSTLYATQFNDVTLYLVTSGKDPVHQQCDSLGSGICFSAWEAIKVVRPNLIINIGTAGGFSKRGAKVGDIFLSAQSFKFHDRLFAPDQKNINYGIGSYPGFDSTALIQMTNRLGVKVGNVSTGGSMLFSQEEFLQMEKNEAHVKEMEAAHIAAAAARKKIPFFAIKVVSDLVDIADGLNAQEQFEFNFDVAMKNLAIISEEIVKFVCKTRLFLKDTVREVSLVAE